MPEKTMERAVENLIFANFILKNFVSMEISEFSSQLLTLSSNRKSAFLSGSDFIKPAIKNNVVIHSYTDNNDNPMEIVSSSSNLAVSLENSARGGFGADMISRQFYTNDLKELGFDEKEIAKFEKKQEFDDIFADLGIKAEVTKRGSSEFENFLGFGDENKKENEDFMRNNNPFFIDNNNNNENNRNNEAFDFFNEKNNEFNQNNMKNELFAPQKSEKIITENPQFMFQGMEHQGTFNFNETSNNNNQFIQANLAFSNETKGNQEKVLQKAKPDEKKQEFGLNLDDFGDLEEEKSINRSQSQENSLIYDQKAIDKKQDFDDFFKKPSENSKPTANIMDFWGQEPKENPTIIENTDSEKNPRIMENPFSSTNPMIENTVSEKNPRIMENPFSEKNPIIIDSEKKPIIENMISEKKLEIQTISSQIPQGNMITEDLFQDFDKNSEKNSQNLENSTEFFYNNSGKPGPEEVKDQNLAIIPQDLSENKLNFWENQNIIEKFKNNSIENQQRANEGVNILENLQRTPSSFDRKRSYDDLEDFRQVISPIIEKKTLKSMTLIEENNENVGFSSRSMKNIRENEEKEKKTDFLKKKEPIMEDLLSPAESDLLRNNEKKQDLFDFQQNKDFSNDFVGNKPFSNDLLGNKEFSNDFFGNQAFSNDFPDFQGNNNEVSKDFQGNKGFPKDFDLLSPETLNEPIKTNENWFGNEKKPEILAKNEDNWFFGNDLKSQDLLEKPIIETARPEIPEKEHFKQPFIMDYFDADSFNKKNYDFIEKNSKDIEEKKVSLTLEEKKPEKRLDFIEKTDKSPANPFENPENFLNNNAILYEKPSVKDQKPDFLLETEEKPDLFEDALNKTPEPLNISTEMPEKATIWTIDPKNIDKANNLIVFSENSSDERKNLENIEKNEFFFDFPGDFGSNEENSDMFKDFKKVDLLENENMNEYTEEKKIKIVNSLRKNEFSIKEDLGTIPEVNEEHDISLRNEEKDPNVENFEGNRLKILENQLSNEKAEIPEKKPEINEKKEENRDFYKKKPQDLAEFEAFLKENSLKTSQIIETEAKIQALAHDFEALKQESTEMARFSLQDHEKLNNLLSDQSSPQKFETLERNLQEMQKIYLEMRKDQEDLKKELKQSLNLQSPKGKDPNFRQIEDNIKEISEKIALKDSISLQNIEKLSGDIAFLQNKQQNLEFGYSENHEKFSVLLESTRNLLEKLETRGFSVEKGLFIGELQKSEKDYENSKENYNVLRNEFSSLLQSFQKEVDIVKNERIGDLRLNDEKIKEFHEVSKEKLKNIENTVCDFKTQFKGLKDFYEILQRDIEKITTFITKDQEIKQKRDVFELEIKEKFLMKTEKLKVSSEKFLINPMSKPSTNPLESPNRRSLNKVMNSVFNISITPPRTEKNEPKQDTVKKLMKNEAIPSNQSQILENSRLSYSDFKEKHRLIDSKHNILISPIRNNPLETIEKFCNEFNQQETEEREKFLRKTYKNDGVFKKVWHDPYEILKEFEEKNKGSIYNFNGDVKISINQSNNLNYEDYKNIYASRENRRYKEGNQKNPNFYLCQEKFKRKIVYVSKKSLAKLIRKMNTASAIFRTDVKNFKKACLGTSTILFENMEIQIGSKTIIKGNQIKINLFISNKSKNVLNHFCLNLQPRRKNLRSNK